MPALLSALCTVAWHLGVSPCGGGVGVANSSPDSLGPLVVSCNCACWHCQCCRHHCHLQLACMHWTWHCMHMHIARAFASIELIMGDLFEPSDLPGVVLVAHFHHCHHWLVHVHRSQHCALLHWHIIAIVSALHCIAVACCCHCGSAVSPPWYFTSVPIANDAHVCIIGAFALCGRDVAGWLCMCGHHMHSAVHGIGGAHSCRCHVMVCPVAFLALHTCVLHWGHCPYS